MSRLLREARHSRGWSSTDLRSELTRAARRLHVDVASDASLRVLISRWENGRAQPDPINRMLLQEVFGLDAAALGLAQDDDGPRVDVTALVAHTSRRAGPSAAVLEYFDRQLGEHMRLDNLAGPNFVLATAQAQLGQVEQMAASGATDLARLASRFAEFTGWLQQDVGNDAEALRLTSRAVDFAEMAGDGQLTTYNRMRKANVLTTAADLPLAASTAERALTDASERFPHLVPVCLRQSALTSARMRDERGARAAIERAVDLTSAAVDTSDAHSSYCTKSYVQMEAALCLLVLRKPAAAEEACREALATWPDGLVRDRTLCLARRGVALVDLNEFDEACRTAMLAIDGVRSAPSGRALHMLRVITTRLRPLGRNTSVRELTEALSEVA
ncbi:MAG: helix-turn-helix domain-containing protein [Tomitella sp.]|nr:helix-turn-helix domain-containing protein [Tomitella sp.]